MARNRLESRHTRCEAGPQSKGSLSSRQPGRRKPPRHFGSTRLSCSGGGPVHSWKVVHPPSSFDCFVPVAMVAARELVREVRAVSHPNGNLHEKTSTHFRRICLWG